MDSKVRDWKTMIVISHNFYHSWRKAVEEKYGKDEASELELRFWELVGEDTANAYINKGKIDSNDIEGLVKGIARSSEIMGEQVEVKKDGDDILLVHTECPWTDSYEASGDPGQCQAGCDRWFETAAQKLNAKFGVKTESCLAAGDDSCLRRFYSK